MRITLETVRETLRSALGRDSFVASFITRVDESVHVPTASIGADGRLRYNPEFVKRHVLGDEDLFCLVLHECMHPMFGHFIHGLGELENIAADMVINASISQLFPHPSGEGSLFKKLYDPHGLQGLLRPQSRMGDSRYWNLYNVFYGRSVGKESWLSAGEVIQTLRILTPEVSIPQVLLLGSHGGGAGEKRETNDSPALDTETLGRIAEDLKRGVKRNVNKMAGYSECLYELFLDALKTHLSIKKALLQKFATKQKVDNFRQSVEQPRVSVSPIPLHPSKRDLVLLSAGIVPFHYHNRATGVVTQKQGLAVYLDVSGSVNEHLPHIVGLLHSLKTELRTIFLFSNTVVEVPFQALLRGEINTTYGTDFNCIAESILARGLDKAVILTDGYASLKPELQDDLKRRHIRTFTVLFGGKDECPEFAPLGGVAQLEDITQ
ncbi:MAG: hypothetical protein HZB26_00640 [Candidatus Hydrogenedentes bacterium]|nr:hypothetical protein [Candidatus Hydrogenedentota bacterium]